MANVNKVLEPLTRLSRYNPVYQTQYENLYSALAKAGDSDNLHRLDMYKYTWKPLKEDVLFLLEAYLDAKDMVYFEFDLQEYVRVISGLNEFYKKTQSSKKQGSTLEILKDLTATFYSKCAKYDESYWEYEFFLTRIFIVCKKLQLIDLTEETELVKTFITAKAFANKIKKSWATQLGNDGMSCFGRDAELEAENVKLQILQYFLCDIDYEDDLKEFCSKQDINIAMDILVFASELSSAPSYIALVELYYNDVRFLEYAPEELIAWIRQEISGHVSVLIHEQRKEFLCQYVAIDAAVSHKTIDDGILLLERLFSLTKGEKAEIEELYNQFRERV